MDPVTVIFFLVLIVAVTTVIFNWRVKNYRAKLIDSYVFPKTIARKVRQVYPHLDEAQARQVLRGLREYFHLIVLSKRKMVSMPSQVVDVAWHEFILFTKEYAEFCDRALGRFLHHTPAEAMKSKTVAQDGIKRAWRLSCYRINIDPKNPQRLPLLFAIDAQLDIPDGFTYQLNCMKDDKNSDTAGGCGGFCASDIGCSSGCSGSSGDADGGCGGGCGGD